jgi:hypothetical protein
MHPLPLATNHLRQTTGYLNSNLGGFAQVAIGLTATIYQTYSGKVSSRLLLIEALNDVREKAAITKAAWCTAE